MYNVYYHARLHRAEEVLEAALGGVEVEGVVEGEDEGEVDVGVVEHRCHRAVRREVGLPRRSADYINICTYIYIMFWV